MAEFSSLNGFDVKDTTARNQIATTNANIKKLKTLSGQNIILIGDSLCLPGRWGDSFKSFSGANCEIYGNGSAGFHHSGITAPYNRNEFFTNVTKYCFTKKSRPKKCY